MAAAGHFVGLRGADLRGAEVGAGAHQLQTNQKVPQDTLDLMQKNIYHPITHLLLSVFLVHAITRLLLSVFLVHAITRLLLSVFLVHAARSLFLRRFTNSICVLALKFFVKLESHT